MALIQNVHVSPTGEQLPLPVDPSRTFGVDYSLAPGATREVPNSVALVMMQLSLPVRILTVNDIGPASADLYVLNGGKYFKKKPLALKKNGSTKLYHHGQAYRFDMFALRHFQRKCMEQDPEACFMPLSGSPEQTLAMPRQQQSPLNTPNFEEAAPIPLGGVGVPSVAQGAAVPPQPRTGPMNQPDFENAVTDKRLAALVDAARSYGVAFGKTAVAAVTLEQVQRLATRKLGALKARSLLEQFGYMLDSDELSPDQAADLESADVDNIMRAAMESQRHTSTDANDAADAEAVGL